MVLAHGIASWNRVLKVMKTPRGAIFAITLWSICMLFYRLGDLAMDPDEGNILKWSTDVYNQTPTFWSLIKYAIREHGFYQSTNYPGLNIFITAAFFHWFGVSLWTARLVSVLIALGVAPLFFCVARRLFHHSTPALISLVMLATSAPIIFLMRQCRYTSLTIVATLWLTWAYLEVLDRKKYGLVQLAGAVLLFFYTAFYIFLPIFIGLMAHAFWHYRGPRKRLMVSGLVLFAIGVSWLTPDRIISGPAWYLSFFQKLWFMDHIAVVYKLNVVLQELNMMSLPVSFILITVFIFRHKWNPYVAWGMMTVCCGVLLTLSPLGDIILKDVVAILLDSAWPTFSPWWFNRLVDPLSWLVLFFCTGLTMLFFYGNLSSAHPVTILIFILVGAMLAYCIVPQYRIPWTRYLASSFIFGFLLAGYLVAQIMHKNKFLGMSMIALHMTSNLLSVLPFVPGQYPYFQWKLPQWIFRLVTGDPVNDIITNFIRVPPL